MSATITIQSVPSQTVSQAFPVSGTYFVNPNFTFADDAGAVQQFPLGSTDPATPVENWAFVHPGYAVSGTHGLAVKDSVTGAIGSTTVAVVGAGVSGVVPLQVGALSIGQITNTSMALTWPLNTTGAAATTYQLQYGLHGSGAFVSGVLFDESPDGSALTSTTGTLFDAQGNAWTLVNGGARGLQIAENGAVLAPTQNVTILLYWNHQIFQQNSSGLWFTPTTQIAGDPRQVAGGVITPSGTFLTSASGVIRDFGNNTYALTGVNGQILINGVIDPPTANVTTLLTFNQNIYQKNLAGNWFQYNGTPGNYTQLAGDPRVQTLAVSGLISNTAYDFKVFATDASGNGPASAVVSGTTNATIASNGFTVNGAQILTPSGSPFIPKIIALYEGFNNNGIGLAAFSAMEWQNWIKAVQALGYNTIRLGMFVQGILNGGWSDTTVSEPFNATLNPDLVGLNMLQIYDKIIDFCATLGNMFVLADIHSTNGANINTGFFSGQATITNPTTWTGDGVSNTAYVNACATLGTRWAGKPAWLGLEMMNEPTTVNFWWGVKTGLIDITAAYTAGGNACHEAILAVNPANPVPLIFCSGINNLTNTYMSGTATQFSNAAGYDLSGVTNKPITLISPNRVVYVVHPFPNNPTFPAAPEGAGTVNNYNTLFGFLVVQNLAPVVATAMGAGNLTTNPSLYPQASTYAPFIVSYLNGTSGLPGAPTTAMGWGWWTGDAEPTNPTDAYAIFNQFTTPLTFVAGCATFIQQLLGTQTPSNTNFTVSSGKVIAPNGSINMNRGVVNYFFNDNGSGIVHDHATISSVFPGLNTFKACAAAGNRPTFADCQAMITDWTTNNGCVLIIASYLYGAEDNIETSNFAGDAAMWANIAVNTISNPRVWFETTNEPQNGTGTVSQDHANGYNAIRVLVNFTGTSNGSQLTISNVSSPSSNPNAKIINGMTINPISGQVPLHTTILSQLSGTPGGAGVYATSGPTTVSGANMSAGNGNMILFCSPDGDPFYPSGEPAGQLQGSTYTNMYNIAFDDHWYGTGNGVASTGPSDQTNSLGNFIVTHPGNSGNSISHRIAGFNALANSLDGQIPVGTFEWGDAYAGANGPHNFGTTGGGSIENQVIACVRAVCNACVGNGHAGFMGMCAWEYGNYGTFGGDVLQNNNVLFQQSDHYGVMVAFCCANPNTMNTTQF